MIKQHTLSIKQEELFKNFLAVCRPLTVIGRRFQCPYHTYNFTACKKTMHLSFESAMSKSKKQKKLELIGHQPKEYNRIRIRLSKLLISAFLLAQSLQEMQPEEDRVSF